MKLKTLKDLERPSKTRVNKTLIDVTELRQEAIKWLKSGKMVEGAKFWVEEFFNIEEEEKEEML